MKPSPIMVTGAELVSLVVDVASTDALQLRVELSDPAPKGGTNVQFSTTPNNDVLVVESMTIEENEKVGYFPVEFSEPAAEGYWIATLSARLGGRALSVSVGFDYIP